MSFTKLNDTFKGLLTYQAGGRCEFAGCNECLLEDSLTKIVFNYKECAHIISDSPNGPRGRKDSQKYAKDIKNIMLLCPKHHKLVDSLPDKFPTKMLRKMKQQHEARVQRLLSLKDNKERTIVLYHANIGSAIISIPIEIAIETLWPKYYPSAEHVEIGRNNSFITENEAEFWKQEEEHLVKLFKQKKPPALI